MVLTKECRICMPLTVEELYMMARHSYQQTECGQGVEIIMNEACEDPKHGKGQYIEKRIHLNGKESIQRKTFDQSIISLITKEVHQAFPTLRTDLETSKIYEEAYCLLQDTRNSIYKELEGLKSSNDSVELVEELHKYNMYKDMAEEVIGSLANLQGTTVKEIHEGWNLPKS